MVAIRARAGLSRFRTVGCVFLLILAATTLAVEGSQPIHVHGGGATGLYNSECPLAALAAFPSASPLPGPAPATWVALTTGLALSHPSERPTARPAGYTDSRAPPAPLG